MIDKYPKVCNICGGKVIYTSNADIYGKEYGSGKCYLCTSCRAFVGTHKPRPREALGILADANMRKGKVMCHEIFDTKWKGKKRQARNDKTYIIGYPKNLIFRLMIAILDILILIHYAARIGFCLKLKTLN